MARVEKIIANRLETFIKMANEFIIKLMKKFNKEGNNPYGEIIFETSHYKIIFHKKECKFIFKELKKE